MLSRAPYLRPFIYSLPVKLMSTLPDSTQKHKLNISMMLKVPIDLEIEVLVVPPTNSYQAEDTKQDKQSFNLIGDSKPEFVINGASVADLDENSQALVSQIVSELEQTSKIFSTLSQAQYQQEKPEKYEQKIAEKYDEYVDTSLSNGYCTVIQPQTQPYNKKIMGRLLDSFNDGFTLVVNTMGTILFLGKLANYSWE